MDTAAAATGGRGIEGIFDINFGLISYMQLILIITAFLTFIYAALLMAARIVALIFLAATSPIGFMGDVLPKISEYSKKWRETLYGQVMIAPVFLLFIYLIINMSSAFAENSIEETPGLTSSDYLTYFKYILTIILLIVAVKVTKKLSGPIGAAVEKLGMAAVGITAGIVTGGAALAMRQTFGRGATNKLNSEYGKDLRAKADSGDRVAQGKLKTLEFASKSSFDVRNSKAGKLAGKGVEKVGGMVGVSVPSLGKGGGIYSKDGKQTGFAGAQQVEQEKANKAYNDASKGVSATDRVAARDALERRRTGVESSLASNTVHTDATNEVKRLKHDGLNSNVDLLAAQKEQREATLDVTTAGTPDQKRLAEERLKKAKKDYEDKKTALIKENEEKYKDELAEQNKIIKEETRKAQLDVEKNLSPDDQKKIARVERARNLAQAMRDGKVGGITGIIRSKLNPGRNKKIASGMESQKEKTEAELLREEMQEMRKEAREAAKNKNP
jgi:hypothetical protein